MMLNLAIIYLIIAIFVCTKYLGYLDGYLTFVDYLEALFVGIVWVIMLPVIYRNGDLGEFLKSKARLK